MKCTFAKSLPCASLRRLDPPHVSGCVRCSSLHQGGFLTSGKGKAIDSRRIRSSETDARVCRSASNEAGTSETVEKYRGHFGDWTLEEEDVQEVRLYRGGLTVAACSLALVSLGAFLPEGPVGSFVRSGQESIALIGAGGLGLSLVLVHIYVTPLKRLLQAFWGFGTASAMAIALTQAEPMPAYVVDHPAAIWLVGPLFAAVTGLAFKEGMCYGKGEAAGIFFVVPILLLGHLSGLTPLPLEKGLLALFTLLFTIFAARKYTQPIKDDIGDKSVFMFQALSEEEQQAKLAQLQMGQMGSED